MTDAAKIAGGIGGKLIKNVIGSEVSNGCNRRSASWFGRLVGLA
jgi:hypothetical protein